MHYFPYHTNDISFDYYNEDSITYNWTQNIIPQNRLLSIWDQRARNILAFKDQNRGKFLSNPEYICWPINAVDSGATGHSNPNDFYLNVLLKDNGIRLQRLISQFQSKA